MQYRKEIMLKNGKACTLRHAVYTDGPAVSQLFMQTHGETDFLLSYPEEHSYDAQGESEFLQKLAESDRELMLLAEVDSHIVGTASLCAVGHKYKVRHRVTFGISVVRDCWGQGIGRALMDACIACAGEAGYEQIELDAVADNERALALYRSAGFSEFGRNPLGFRSRSTGRQELVYMRLELPHTEAE